MDPIHLTDDQLDYELALRGINNLSHRRIKQSKLREFLQAEAKGIETLPESNTSLLLESEDMNSISQMFEDICVKIQKMFENRSSVGVDEARSQLIHLKHRIARLSTNEDAGNDIFDLSKNVNDLFSEIEEYQKEIVSRKAPQVQQSFNLNLSKAQLCPDVPSALSNLSIGGAAAVVESSKKASIQGRIRESLIEIASLSENEKKEIAEELDSYLLNPNAVEFRPSSINTGAIKKVTAPRNHPFTPKVLPKFDRFPKEVLSQSTSGSIFSSARNSYPYKPIPKGFTNYSNPPQDPSTIPINPQFTNMGYGYGNQHFSNQYNIHPLTPPNPDYSPYRDQPFERNFNNYRRKVPVNQWRIQFSGVEPNNNVHEFLAQIKLLQRAEGVSDQELLYAIVHLLDGRARQWHFNIYDKVGTWEQFVNAFKNEFLPTNHDYLLLSTIESRLQMKSETIGTYIIEMQSLFKRLSIPLQEAHKVYIVQKNLLRRYALSVAPLGIETLEELSKVCKRIDSYRLSTDQAEIKGQKQVYCIEEKSDDESSNCSNEVCPLGIDKPGNTTQKFSKNVNSSYRRACFNCKKEDHHFRDCDQPRTRVFCFGCGTPEVISTECQKCSGKVKRNPKMAA